MIAQISSEKLQLSQLNNQEIYLDSQEKQLENAQAMLSQQIAESEKSIEETFKARPDAVANVSDAARAMTVLMFNNQIQAENTRLADLKERLTVGIGEKWHQLKQDREELKGSKQTHALEIDRLESELAKLRVNLTLNQAKQKNAISTIENKLNDIYETRAIAIATRSAKPIGLGKVGILQIFFIVGMLGGVMLAFFIELFNYSRQRS